MIHFTHIAIISILFLLFLPITSFAQYDNLEFEHIAAKDGLSQISVFCIVQDIRGFMWFGTADGLNKYDGYSFTVYKHDPQDLQSLSDNIVYSVYEDQSGTLWIGTFGGGLNKFDREKETFTHYKHDPDDPQSLSDNGVYSICEDQSGVLWIGTFGGGLNKFDREKETFVHYKQDPNDPKSLSSNRVLSIYEDQSGVLWIGTFGGGLNKFDREKETFTHYKHGPDDPQSLSDNTVFSIYEDQSGVLWIGTFGGGLNKFDRERESITHYKHDPDDPQSLSDNRVYSIYEDQSGVLWIGTRGGGLNKLDREKETFVHYKHDPDDPKSLSGNWVLSIYEDQSGVLWIGTYGGGLNKFDREKETFVYYKHRPNDPKSLSANDVRSIYEDQTGVIWIGTDGGGLNKFNRVKESFVHYKHDPNDPQSLSDNTVFSIYEDQTGVLWIGTDGGGLNKFDREKGTFVHYKHNANDPKSLSNNIVTSIHEDHSGVLWIGTYRGGLEKFDREKGTFVHYEHNANDPKSLSNNIVTSIHEDQSGVLWIGTRGGGLNKFDREKETFGHYKYDPDDSQSLSDNGVFSIYEDQTGVIWIGTYGGGLNKFDRARGTFQQYREKDGLPNDVIYGILEDDNRNLWLSTNKGLSKFNLQTKKFRNYDIRDGLQGNEFNQEACHKSKSGNMFFGGINGFNIFHPDSIKDNPYIPPIVIIDFQIFNKSVSIFKGNSSEERPDTLFLDKHISEIDELILSYQESVFSFEFAALDFHIPEKNKYAYNMEGFDRDWNYTNADRRFGTYTNLDPGEYTFRVKGSNNDGIWNEDGASIKIIILPPWWATWWAYILYVMFIVSLFTGVTRFYLNRQRLKHQLELEHEHSEKLEEIDKMKSRFFANISHEFRTPLTLILGPSENIITEAPSENATKQAGAIKRNANRLLVLINQLLDLSKLEAGKLELKASKSNIVSFIKGITMSFESVAEGKDITLKVKSSNDEIEIYLDKEKMTKILNNLLSNAFKFTPDGGHITVSVIESNTNSVGIKIRDTGVGIAKEEIPKLFDRFYQVDSSQTREHEGTGIGLALTKELVGLHHGSISVDSKLGDPDKVGTGWTEFTIDLPEGKNHLKNEEIVEGIESDQTNDVILIPPEREKNLVLESEESIEVEFEDKSIILIVEDNADVREYIKDSLGKEFHIEEAANGEQGVRKAENIIPDLIISDVMMPKMDGNELTRILKNDEKTSHIPIILLTAKSEQESKLEGLETGADDYLTKPFDTKELQIRIYNLISLRRKLQVKYSKADFVPVKKEEENLPRPGEARAGKLSNLEEQFMCKVLEVIENHISEEEFSIEQFGKEVGMSRVQLHRKLKALSGKSASNYLRSVRLNKAKQMIEEEKGNISEIAYSVGFSSPQYFTRCFKEEYGYPPSDLTT